MTDTIYCSWVEDRVDVTKLNEHCNPVDGKCTQCKRSPQLDFGVKSSELIPNISRQ